MGKTSQTWSFMRASWQVLKMDKKMLIFPLISGICCLLVIVSFAMNVELSENDALTTSDYVTLFLIYFCNYFVIIFFNSAIIACATIRMAGGDPKVSDGFRAALTRLPLIAGWALVSASVGLALRIIENRLEKAGEFVASLLGMAWTVMSFLVIPILVIEKKGPITAFRESTALLKKTWGEQLVGNFSFGLVFFLLSLPALLLIAAAVAGVFTFPLDPLIGIAIIILAVIYLIVLALVQSTLQAIFQAAIYLYARDGEVSVGFESEMLRTAIVPR